MNPPDFQRQERNTQEDNTPDDFIPNEEEINITMSETI